MRKLRERLNNRKGFTLVELIVVIVIILILAAVLIPNVMRYIGQARESTFQSEASGYLTEITGYEAEHFAKYGTDFGLALNGSSASVFGPAEATPTDATTGAGAKYALTAFDKKLSGGVTVFRNKTGHTDFAGSDTKNSIKVTVYNGAVIEFSYTDNTYYVNWTQSGGWGTVGKRTS